MDAFMNECVLPAEAAYNAEMTASPDPHHRPAVIDELAAEARRRGLWNLFLTMSNRDYAPIAEASGHSLWLAPEALNCSPPDAGNMEILERFATPEQREQWLEPLKDASIRSCFAMTEPDVASSDARAIALRIDRDGDDYVLNGRKWWITGAADPRCRVALVLGRTGAEHSIVLVPMNTPGLTVVRDLPVFGHHDREGHCELVFENVRIPRANLLGDEGDGFTVAQARLGPGRIHHCMRMVGAAERALRLMCERVTTRMVRGRPLSDQGVIRQWIAESRVEIDQARLLTLHAAQRIDDVGTKDAQNEIAAIKVVAPRMATRVIDRAIQAHGAMGVGPDTPLGAMYVQARWLRIGDGPDEVHLDALARAELRKYGDPKSSGL